MINPEFALFMATNNLVVGWSTAGVSGGADGVFYNPTPLSFPSSGICQLGSFPAVAQVPPSIPCLFSLDLSNPTPPVAPPTGFTQVWNTGDLPGGNDGYLWLPTAPDGYAALGCVFTGSPTPPDPGTVWCVRLDLVYQAQPGEIAQVWSTAGISGGADLALTVFNPSSSSPGVTTSSICAVIDGYTQPVLGLIGSAVRPSRKATTAHLLAGAKSIVKDDKGRTVAAGQVTTGSATGFSYTGDYGQAYAQALGWVTSNVQPPITLTPRPTQQWINFNGQNALAVTLDFAEGSSR